MYQFRKVLAQKATTLLLVWLILFNFCRASNYNPSNCYNYDNEDDCDRTCFWDKEKQLCMPQCRQCFDGIPKTTYTDTFYGNFFLRDDFRERCYTFSCDTNHWTHINCVSDCISTQKQKLLESLPCHICNKQLNVALEEKRLEKQCQMPAFHRWWVSQRNMYQHILTVYSLMVLLVYSISISSDSLLYLVNHSNWNIFKKTKLILSYTQAYFYFFINLIVRLTSYLDRRIRVSLLVRFIYFVIRLPLSIKIGVLIIYVILSSVLKFAVHYSPRRSDTQQSDLPVDYSCPIFTTVQRLALARWPGQALQTKSGGVPRPVCPLETAAFAKLGFNPKRWL